MWGQGVSAGDALNAKAQDYEVLAASEIERAPLGDPDEHMAAATAFAAVAIALREVALALDEAAWRVSFSPLQYGVDDLTLGFEMNGLRSSVAKLNELPGVQTTRGKMLGHRTSWGQWAHYLGRSVALWKADTKRLYVQAKLAPEGELCPPQDVGAAAGRLIEHMENVGLASWDSAWVTRLDVAVDASCDPAEGKLLLDALEAARLPKGWRTTSAGMPRSTVYFRAARSEKVVGRAYCRNLKLKRGEPFGLIRLEAQQRWGPKAAGLATVASPAFIAHVWRSRFAELASRVVRLPGDVQALELGRRVARKELRASEAERLHLFLALERLGVAVECYPRPIYAARRREAAKLGYGANDEAGALEVELGDLLRPYRDAVELHLAA
jgi:hypothetical protein